MGLGRQIVYELAIPGKPDGKINPVTCQPTIIMPCAQAKPVAAG